MKTWADAAAVVGGVAAIVGSTALIALAGWMAAKKACEMLAARDARRVDRELAAARLADQAAWRDFVSGHPEASHPYVRWDHCDQCYGTFERTNNAEGGRR